MTFYPAAGVTLKDSVYSSNADPLVSYEFNTSWEDEEKPWSWNTCITRTEGALVQEAQFKQETQYGDIGHTYSCEVPEQDYHYEDGVKVYEYDEQEDEHEECAEVGMRPIFEPVWIPKWKFIPAKKNKAGEIIRPPSMVDRGHFVDRVVDYEPIILCSPVFINSRTPSYNMGLTTTVTVSDGFDFPLPRKSISITGFNGRRTEYRAMNYDRPDLGDMDTNGGEITGGTVSGDCDYTFNGDSYQIVTTANSARLVGRYSSPFSLGAKSYVSTKEVSYQFTSDAVPKDAPDEDNPVSGSGGDEEYGSDESPVSSRAYGWKGFTPNLPGGNYGYRTDRQYYDIDLTTGDKNPGRLFWEENPNRSWSMYEYYSDASKKGLIKRIIQPFGDTPRPESTVNLANTQSGYGILTRMALT